MSDETTLPLPMMPRFQRYQIVREIGRGTMGVVYEAFDNVLERTVALKTVRLEGDTDEIREFEERFQREAKSAGRISHPSIVTIHDAGKEGGVSFIAMEFIAGRTLREIIDSGELPETGQIIDWVAQITDGLEHAHRAGIVHRDIKPANVVVQENGLVKLTDFGIAQMPAGDLTHAGTLLGTPKYMSPEQLRGERLDGRSDLFSLGIIFYELLTGKTPFEADNLAGIMYKILHEPPENPASCNPQCSERLCSILARCLSKDKTGRYADAGEMLRDLRQRSGQPVEPDLRAAVFRTAPTVTGNLEKTVGKQGIARSENSAGSSPAGWRNRLLWLVPGALLAIMVVAGLAAILLSGPRSAEISSESVAKTGSGVVQDGKKMRPASGQGKKKTSSHAGTSSSEAANSNRKTKKGFWRRQVDCIRHGICDKPVQQSPQPHQPITP